MLRITRGSGFHITFSNGWSISVQWSRGNYCSNMRPVRDLQEPEPTECTDAEIAIWDNNGDWYEFEHDQVLGHVLPDDVAAWIAFTQKQEPRESK